MAAGQQPVRTPESVAEHVESLLAATDSPSIAVPEALIRASTEILEYLIERVPPNLPSPVDAAAARLLRSLNRSRNVAAIVEPDQRGRRPSPFGGEDLEKVIEGLRSLPTLAQPVDYAEFRYASLPLCVLDAIFSINARWESVRAAVGRYAARYGLPLTHPPGILPNPEEQATVDDLIAHISSVGPDRFAADVMRNRMRTSTRGGILKAEAALRFAEVLKAHGIQVIQDMSQRLTDSSLEADLMKVHGQSSGVAVRYFLMLAGAHHLIKPDRMVVAYLSRVLGERVDADRAQAVLGAAAEALSLEYPTITPQLIDAAIWTYEREHRKKAGEVR
jgi:hypothetical protein